MRLNTILSDIEILSTNIPRFDICVGHICSDTTQVKQGDVFVCKRGTRLDGHDFIKQAYDKGARVFVIEHMTDYLNKNKCLRYIRVGDSRSAEAKLLNAAWGYPTRDMHLIGITGTNGKTSSAYMLRAILKANGWRTGLIGTVKTLADECDITHKSKQSDYNSMTTPPPCELFSTLAEMRKLGVEYVIMEASSHALSQKRLDALHFELGIFTNLSEDHLDYHKSISEYRAAKAHLFELCDTALINTDATDGRVIAESCNSSCKVFTYGKQEASSFFAKNAKLDRDKTSFDFCEAGSSDFRIDCPIPGEFTIYNAMAASGGARLLGVDKDVIKSALFSLAQIPGRLERICVPADIDLYIDYAHTPDALENVLETLRPSCRARLITVFGCGGDREREKRPMMGRIATALSDITVITSDNSRSERTEDIISHILLGVKRTSVCKVIPERVEAIRYALSCAKDGDTVLLAGKGHEDYEIDAHGKHSFSEKAVIYEYYAQA